MARSIRFKAFLMLLSVFGLAILTGLCVDEFRLNVLSLSSHTRHSVNNIDTQRLNASNSPVRSFEGPYLASSRTYSSYVRRFDILTGNRQANVTKPFECVSLIGPVPKTPICIYNPKTDVYVSGSIKKYRTWEDHNVKLVVDFLKLNEDVEFLDLGCNIGVYTLTVAKLGRRVVAVDANVANLIFLSRSLVLGGLQDRDVTLLWNAVSDRVEEVGLVPGYRNIGGTGVKTLGKSDIIDEHTEEKIISITLDDLVGFFENRTVFIKMDIEKYEWKALSGAKTFLTRVNVEYILMEWMHHKITSTGRDIIKFLTAHSYRPYNPYRLPLTLRVELKNRWPNDVLWIKDEAQTIPLT